MMLWLLGCWAAAPKPLPEMPPLELEVKGQPVPVRSVLAATRGGNTVHIVLSEKELTCEDLDRRLYSARKPGSRWVELQLTRQWGDEASPTWMLGTTSEGPGLSVHRVDPSSQVVIEVDIEGSVRGGIVAEGCGDRPQDDRQPLPELSATVGGTPVPLHGAWVDGRTLVMSNHPKVCGTRHWRDPTDLDVRLTANADGTRWDRWEVSGRMFPGTRATSTADGLAPVQGSLSDQGYSGPLELRHRFDQAEVVLSGTVDAAQCGP